MKQTKAMSLAESTINIAVGFSISLAAQMIFLPLLGVSIVWHQNIAFAVIMTVISFARSFLLRRLFEALHIRTPLSPALLAIAAERRRQVEVEGYDATHDDAHSVDELACAAAAYAMAADRPQRLRTLMPACWPWDKVWWKPKDDTRRNLVVAGALIVAAIDRLERMRKQAPRLMSRR